MNADCRTSFRASEQVVYQIVAFCQRLFSKNLRDVAPWSPCLNREAIRTLGVFSRIHPNMFGWVWSAPFPRGPPKGLRSWLMAWLRSSVRLFMEAVERGGAVIVSRSQSWSRSRRRLLVLLKGSGARQLLWRRAPCLYAAKLDERMVKNPGTILDILPNVGDQASGATLIGEFR